MKANEFVKKYDWDTAKMNTGYPDGVLFFQYGNSVISTTDLKCLVEAHELVNECGGLDSCVKKLAVREKFKPKAEYFAIHHEKPHLIQMYARSEPKLTPNYSFKKLIQAIKLVESCQ